MRITYLKMENLKSILAGMGKNKVEIDFTKGKNNKILLLGGNGSGKSIILSSASPYRGTNDNRPVEPIEGKTGKKIIHFEHNGDKYEIEHFYGKNNKSYIKKNGKELNENGNIRSFNSVMENELDISSDYFAVGRLGDNVENFINYSTAERKKYINKFIPNIDDYLIAYKNSSEKVTTYNKRLKSLNIQLEKYGTLEELLNIKQELENEKETKSKEVSKKEVRLDSILDDLASLSESLQDKDHKSSEIIVEKFPKFKQMAGHFLPNVIENIEKEQSVTKDELDRVYLRYEQLKGRTINECKDKMAELDSKRKVMDVELESAEYKLSTAQSHYNDIKGKISEINSKLNSFEDINTEEMKNVVVELEDKLKESENSIRGINPEKFPLTLSEAKEIKNEIEFLKRELSRISDNKTNLDEDLYQTYGFQIESLVGVYNAEYDKKEKLESEIRNINKKLNEIYKESGLLKILEVSEHHEHTKECPFVTMAVGVQDEVASIDDLENEIRAKENTIIEVQNPLIEKISNHYQYVKSFKENIVDRIYNEKFTKLGIDKEDYMKTLLVSDTSKYENNFSIVDSILKYYTSYNEVQTLNDKLEAVKAKLTLSEKIEEDKKELNAQLDKYLEDRNSLFTNINEVLEPAKKNVIKSMERNRLSKDIYEGLHSKLEALESINLVLNELKGLSEEMKEIDNKMLSLRNLKNELIDEVENDKKYISQLDTKLDKANRDYYMVESINKELEEITSVYDNLLAVNTSLDPKKGIPLIFINNYLTDIAERANSLLDIAYKGNFFIKFEVNEKEFKIIVTKGDGTELNDISLASQGEVAMTNTSLSLSMLANITKGYNILYFDEVDGTLDNDNRRNFLSVLDLQIATLNSEQTFIISHNNEFYSADVDLILLDGYESKIDIKDKTMMSNKTILYKN